MDEQTQFEEIEYGIGSQSFCKLHSPVRTGDQASCWIHVDRPNAAVLKWSREGQGQSIHLCEECINDLHVLTGRWKPTSAGA